MNGLRLGLAAALLVLGGCGTLQRRPAGAMPPSPPSAGHLSPPAPVQDAFSPLPEAFQFVLRAPPSWRGRVDAQRVILESPSIRRDLQVERSEPLFDGRGVVARDEGGTVEIRATLRLCEDPADGTFWPYTVRLSITDHAPVLGCGGPLDVCVDPAGHDGMH
jgi:hypothetical protein